MKLKNLATLNYYGVNENVAVAYAESLHAHIHYVQQAGLKIGVADSLLEIHDNSKWTAAEFPGYARHFHGGGAPDLFSYAWLHHIHHNPHHWQYYIFPDGFTPPGSTVENGTVHIPNIYALEMVADWMGSEMVRTGSWDMTHWLTDHIPKIRVHSMTAKFLQEVLEGLGYSEVFQKQKFAAET